MSDNNTTKKVNQLVDHLFREEYGRVVSFLTATFGFHFMEIAEDIAQDTLVEACRNWSYHGIPNNPQGWIFKVAKNKAFNWIRREKKRQEIYRQQGKIDFGNTSDNVYLEQEIEDSMLRMIFACCAPEISIEKQIVLILSILCGFSRREIAHALLSNEETIKKRLFRAKKEIREKYIHLETPTKAGLKSRLPAVYSCLYLLFNEGYNSSHHDDLIRKDLCLEAIRLNKLLVSFFKEESTPKALLALMYFHVARFESRIDEKGAIILFKNQDRSLWDSKLINAGVYYLTESANSNILSSYHLEAHIAALHCTANSFEETNWAFIYKLYEQLYQFKSSPIIHLNMAIVKGVMEGPQKAVELLENFVIKNEALNRYYLLYATLGEFYKEMKKFDLATFNFKRASELTSSLKEKQLLIGKIDECREGTESIIIK